MTTIRQNYVRRAGALQASGVSGSIKTADDVLAALVPSRVFYASKLGAVLDGVSDDTSIIQSALNAASLANPIKLILDGVACLTSGLDIKSGTFIDARGCTITLKAGSNRQLLRNANRSRASITDDHIEIVGGIWDGNRDNQTAGGVVSSQMSDNTYMAALGFYGIKNLRLSGLTIRKAKSFALHLANWQNVWLRDLWVDNNDGANTQDGIHCNGPGSFLYAGGLRLNGYDDVFALNADDGLNDISVSNAFGPYVGIGSITDVEVDGIALSDSLFGVRIMSRVSRIERIRIHGIRGRCLNYWGVIDGFSGSNNGNYGSIDLEADVYCHDAINGADIGGLVVTNNVERLKVCCTRHDWPGNRSSVLVKAGSVLDQLEIDVSIRDAVAGAPQGPVSILGRVRNLRLGGQWYSTDGSVTGGLLYAVGGQVDRAEISALIPATCSKVYPGSTVTLVGGEAAPVPHKEVVLSTASVSPGISYADVGNLSLAITHGPGDYHVRANIRSQGSGGDALVVRLAVNGTGVANSERQCVAPLGFESHTVGLGWDLDGLLGTETITLQAQYQAAATVAILSDANGRSSFGYQKYGY